MTVNTSYLKENVYLETICPEKSRELFHLICRPGESPSECNVKEIFESESLKNLPWVPDSVKSLFEKTAFVDSAAKVMEALEKGKEHIVWSPVKGMLLAWKKDTDGFYFFQVFSDKPPLFAPLAGGIPSLFFAWNPGSDLSEWTGEMKSRVDPIALQYKKVPPSVFSKVWLEALKGEEQVVGPLFVPLEKYRSNDPMPDAVDEKGYQARFMTRSRGGDSSWWLYKAWMRQLLPLEDYRKFHFLHRFSLLEAHGEDYEVAAKLLRSLKKGKFVVEKGIQERLEEMAVKKEVEVPPSFGPLPLMPEHRLAANLLRRREEPIASVAPEAPNHEAQIPFQWHQRSVNLSEILEINDPIWDISEEKDKLKKIQDLSDQHNLFDCSLPLVEKAKRFVIFKRLLKQFDNKLGESFILLDEKYISRQLEWNSQEEYEEFQKYAKELVPQESIYIENRGVWMIPESESLVKYFLFTLEGIKSEDALFPKIWEFRSLRSINAPSITGFPKASKWLNWLLKRISYSNDESGNSVNPGLYLAESSVTRGESYDPWNYPRRVAKEALPYIGPEQALINYRELHDSRKLNKYAQEDLFSTFFQEAWQTEDLLKEAKTWWGGENEISSKALLEAKAKGKLPWVECLKNPHFQQMLERFLQEELELKKTPILTLIQLSALCARYCPTLKTPDFTSVILKEQEELASMDGSYDCRLDVLKNVQTLRLYLFLLYAEKKDPRAKEYRPFTLKEYHLARKNDKERILHYLKTLPDLPTEFMQCPIRVCKNPFDWYGWVSEFFGENGMIEKTVNDIECNFLLYGKRAFASRSDGKFTRIFCDGNILVENEKGKLVWKKEDCPLITTPFVKKGEEAKKAPTIEGENRDHGVLTTLWTGEEVKVVYESGEWKLENRPQFYWKARQGEGIHNNEWVDKEGNVAFHLFHLPLISGNTTFAISYVDGEYHPNEIEEYLCLLLQYCRNRDFPKILKLCKELPLFTHRFSPISQELMQQILGMLVPKQSLSFDQLATTMHVFERFHTWMQNPTLKMPKEMILGVSAACLQSWNVYRDVAKNIAQGDLLTKRQRDELSRIYPKTIAILQEGVIANSPIAVPKWVSSYIRTLPLTSQKVAWRRNTEISLPDTAVIFHTRDSELRSNYCSYEGERTAYMTVKSYALWMGAIFLRYVGFGYIWQARINELEGEDWIPREYLKPDEKILKRLELLAAKGDKYRTAIIDYALENDFIAYEGESVGAFLARVEQHKHTKNILSQMFSIIYGLYAIAVKIYQGLPHRVELLGKNVREPFISFSKGIKIGEKERCILGIANKQSIERDSQLRATLERKVDWGDLERLFIQNRMDRLQEINPLLSTVECHQIDALMQEYFIDPTYVYKSYIPTEESAVVRALLVFERKTGMKIRPQQADKLKTFLTDANMAMQMGMGEGKTAVLTSIMLILLAKPGRISMYMPPAAQYTTLVSMLTKWQKDRFGQEVIPIEMEFSLMQDIESLEWVKERLLQAKEIGAAILLHPSTAHNLRLAYMSEEDPEKLALLFEIRKELKENADIVFDEIDQLEDPLKDTSMAVGKKKTPALHHLKQFQELIYLHQKDPCLWSALCRNTPQEIHLQQFKDFQLKEIAPLLAEKFRVPDLLRASFCNYMVGKGESPRDDKLLQWVDRSKERNEIALHKHWIEDILHFTVMRERKRHYGRSQNSAEIVPYSGVDCPTKTKFAQLGEEMSYYFLNALSSKLSEKEFQEVLDPFIFRFKHYENKGNSAGKEKVRREFEEITGSDLSKIIEDSKMIEEVREKVNEDPLKRLKCEVYLARKHITYYESQLSSTSQDLLSMFNTRRGFSGTFPGYIEEFDQIVVSDTESDASVAKAMREHKEPIVTIDPRKGFFSQFNEKTPLGGVIDTGAIFRNQTNYEVAETVLKELPQIETVFFFGKRTPADESPDTPCIMKRSLNGGFTVHVVGTTDQAALAAFGVKLETLFVYYDQRHSEATDVVQLPNRHNVLTFGLQTTKRDLFQGIMRLRKYKEKQVHQEITFAIEEKTRDKLFGDQEMTTDSLIQKAKEIEKKETELRTYRTYYHRINAAFFEVIEEYMAAHVKDTKKIAPLRRFFLHYLIDPNPYKQFGGISGISDPLKELHQYRKARQKQFSALYPEAIPKTLLAKLDEIEKKAKESPHLPKEVPAKKSFALGQTQQQEQKQEQEVRQEVEQRQETTRVLPTPPEGSRFVERVDFKRIDLSSHFGSWIHHYHLISKKFESELFQGLYASENFVHTYTTAYPINHPNQKRAHYLLLERKDGHLHPTVLSNYDYHNYRTGKKTLVEGSSICYWKPSKEGALQILQGKDFQLTEKEEIQLKKIRLQIAFLNGNASYITDHHTDLGSPIEEKHLQFLKKRVEYWQLKGERMESWWIFQKMAQFFGAGRVYQSHYTTSYNEDYSTTWYWDIHGRNHVGDYAHPYEKEEVENLLAVLEEA